MTISYLTVLHDHGLRDVAATNEEKALATECAQLRSLLLHGACHHDVATLRNVQAQRNKIVEAAERVADDPSMLVTLFGAVREWRRITAPASPEVARG